jgi:hypothetical protein
MGDILNFKTIPCFRAAKVLRSFPLALLKFGKESLEQRKQFTIIFEFFADMSDGGLDSAQTPCRV